MDDTNNSNSIIDHAEAAADTRAAADVEPSELQRQRDEYYDLLLRKSAEFDNYRKRVERERQASAEAGAVAVMEELLPLMDDLERALKVEVGPDGAEPYRKGVELIYRQLTDLLEKRGVRPIDALGADFDPHVHQAVSYDPVEGHRDGEVIEDYRRGYMLGDRLLRPAMVRVAKG